jgi:hypothetical protein
MRRREKFVISSILLSLGLLAVQYFSLEYRYLAVAVFSLVSYLVSAWTLADDLQRVEWLTIVPFPAMYAGAVGLFYFLLPEHILSKIFVFILFGIGMYALFLTSNIYSVAKGRTIQLLHAAHAVGLLFSVLTSLLITNTIFSLRLPFYVNGAFVGVSHLPLILMSLWAVELEPRVKREVWGLTGLLTLFLVEVATVLSLFPFSVWTSSLFIMAVLYIGLGVLQNFLKGRLFQSAINEYSLVATFVGILFLVLIPGK